MAPALHGIRPRQTFFPQSVHIAKLYGFWLHPSKSSSSTKAFVNRTQRTKTISMSSHLPATTKPDCISPKESLNLISLLQMQKVFPRNLHAPTLPNSLSLALSCSQKQNHLNTVLSLNGPWDVTRDSSCNYVRTVLIGLSCSLPLRRCFMYYIN